MKITEQIIESKLKNFSIPQGECAKKAFEIASILFDQEVSPFSEIQCHFLYEVLCIISGALAYEKIVIIWLDTGPIDPQNPGNRALHCYFIFEDKPLRAFAIWADSGVEFYDDAFMKENIVNTINLFDHVGLHIVPPSHI